MAVKLAHNQPLGNPQSAFNRMVLARAENGLCANANPFALQNGPIALCILSVLT
jgi:hypothetical protein